MTISTKKHLLTLLMLLEVSLSSMLLEISQRSAQLVAHPTHVEPAVVADLIATQLITKVAALACGLRNFTIFQTRLTLFLDRADTSLAIIYTVTAEGREF